jgi:hypothetical protein
VFSVLFVLEQMGRLRRLRRQQVYADLAALSWAQFERVITDAFRRHGYRVRETGGRNQPDGGGNVVLQRDGDLASETPAHRIESGWAWCANSRASSAVSVYPAYEGARARRDIGKRRYGRRLRGTVPGAGIVCLNGAGRVLDPRSPPLGLVPAGSAQCGIRSR